MFAAQRKSPPHGRVLNREGVHMRFLVQLLLAFAAGLVLGYMLLNLWDVIAPQRGALDPFDARYR